MTWRDDIEESQQNRLRQIEQYHDLYGYPPDSDMFLLVLIAEIADTKEWLLVLRGDVDRFLRENGFDPAELGDRYRRIAEEALKEAAKKLGSEPPHPTAYSTTEAQ